MHLCFSITAHGFGHGAISCAVINYIVQTHPEIEVTVLTELPESYLRSRINGPFNLIKMAHDFGMLMSSAIVVDVDKSAAKYQDLYEHWQQAIEAESACLKTLNVDCLISNISPISLAAAQYLGIKTATVAPFNWAQIYQQYCLHSEQAIVENAAEIYQTMAAIYHAVDYIYKPLPSVPCEQNNEIHIASISSQPKRAISPLKPVLANNVNKLGLIALGGLTMPLDLDDWPEIAGWHWIVDQLPPLSRNDMTKLSELPYPFLTLLAECDLVLTKPGYGTYCEIASMASLKAVRVISLARPDWPETPYLNTFLAQRVPFVEIETSQLNKLQLAVVIEKLFALDYPAELPCEQGEVQLVEHLLNNLSH